MRGHSRHALQHKDSKLLQLKLLQSSLGPPDPLPELWGGREHMLQGAEYSVQAMGSLPDQQRVQCHLQHCFFWVAGVSQGGFVALSWPPDASRLVFCPAKTHVTQKRVQLGAASPCKPLFPTRVALVMMARAELMLSLLISHSSRPWETSPRLLSPVTCAGRRQLDRRESLSSSPASFGLLEGFSFNK